MRGTDYEPKTIKYAARFSWDGKQFEKRPGQSRKVVYRRKRSNDMSPRKPKNSNTSTELSRAGTIVFVSNIITLDKYLTGSPRSPFKFPRGLFMIILLSTNEPDFDELAEKLLEKLWNQYFIGNVAIITPCDRERKVCFPKNIFGF